MAALTTATTALTATATDGGADLTATAAIAMPTAAAALTACSLDGSKLSCLIAADALCSCLAVTDALCSLDGPWRSGKIYTSSAPSTDGSLPAAPFRFLV